MSLAGFQSVVIDNPRGPIIRTDVTDVPVGLSLISLNAEYNVGQVQKRLGFSQVWNPAESINAIFNWIRITSNFLLYSSATSFPYKIKYVSDLTTPAPVDIFTWDISSADGAVFANSGNRVVVANFDAGAIGPKSQNQCRVVLDVSGTLVGDMAFPPPITNALVLSGAAGGSCSGGNHRFGYVITYRSGFTGKICPVDSNGVFNKASAGSLGNKTKINGDITITWPTGAVSVQAVMTPANNLNRFFLVPFQSVAVVGGVNSLAHFVFDISDDDLLAEATEITDNFNLFTQTPPGGVGTGPFNPHYVFTYGQRMSYIADVGSPSISTCFFSEPEDHQHITADQHGITLPGFLRINNAFVVRNVAYLLGPNWTYAVQDTGDVPVQWPTPVLVDGEIGTTCALGTTVNAAGGFAWVVSKRGLEMFSAGQYGSRPMSFYIADDWSRIHFGAGGAASVRIIDDQVRQRVMILVPLDGSNSPTHIMVFSYQFGLTPEAMAAGYSLWNLDGFSLGTLGLVQDPLTNLVAPWITSYIAGPVVRPNLSTDTNPQRDPSNAAVSFLWESGLLPPVTKEPGRVWRAQALNLRVTGPANSVLQPTLYAVDRVRSAPAIREIVLSTAPGQEHLRRIKQGFNSQAFSLRLEESTLDGGALISMVSLYYSPHAGWSPS